MRRALTSFKVAIIKLWGPGRSGFLQVKEPGRSAFRTLLYGLRGEPIRRYCFKPTA